jgi:hypothetical protein
MNMDYMVGESVAKLSNPAALVPSIVLSQASRPFLQQLKLFFKEDYQITLLCYTQLNYQICKSTTALVPWRMSMTPLNRALIHVMGR